MSASKNLLSKCPPVEFCIDINSTCNTSCVFCFGASRAPHIIRPDMPLDDFKQILGTMEGIEHIGMIFFSGGYGESILHPQFKEFLQVCRDYGKKVGFYTNGMALTTRDDIDEILKLSDKITISIFSSDSALQQKFMPGIDSEKILKLLKEKKENMRHCSLLFNAVVCKANLDHLAVILEKVLDAGANFVVFNGLRNCKLPKMEPYELDTLTEEDRAILKEQYHKCMEIGGRRVRFSSNLHTLVFGSPDFIPKDESELDIDTTNIIQGVKGERVVKPGYTLNCIDAWTKVMVNTGGKRSLLCCHSDANPLGSLFDGPVLYNQKHQEICDGLLRGELKYGCRYCDHPEIPIEEYQAMLRKRNFIE